MLGGIGDRRVLATVAVVLPWRGGAANLWRLALLRVEKPRVSPMVRVILL